MGPETIQKLEAEQIAALSEEQLAGWSPEARAFFKEVKKVGRSSSNDSDALWRSPLWLC